jgi:hypothetical protein
MAAFQAFTFRLGVAPPRRCAVLLGGDFRKSGGRGMAKAMPSHCREGYAESAATATGKPPLNRKERD